MNKKKRIDQILVDKGLVESRTKAQAIVMAGKIYVDNKKINKSSEEFEQNIDIKIKNLNNSWVSRGGLKLYPVIKNNKIKVKDAICIDIGSSTGGFSDVLLKFSVKKIYAVDVGYGQLHERIKSNLKVFSFERTNARYLNDKIIREKVDLITCDASFISLKKIINNSLYFLKKNGLVIALIKPQFEANKKEIRKGVVYERKIHKRICDDIKLWFEKEKNFKVLKIEESEIIGPKGNKEFFIIASKNS